VFLAGCDDSVFTKKLVPPEDEAIARNYVEMLRRGEVDEIQRQLERGVAQPNDREELVQLSALFPPEDPRSSEVVGLRLYPTRSISPRRSTIEYQLRDRWLLWEHFFSCILVGR
jgi:hypothetical protein